MPQGHVWRKLKICLCKRITYPPSQIIWNPRNQSDSGSRRLDMLGRLRFVSLDHNGSLTMGSNQKFCGQHQSLPVVWISIAVYWEREYVAASELTSKVACWKVLQACPKKWQWPLENHTRALIRYQIDAPGMNQSIFATRPYAHLMADCKHCGPFHLIDWIIGDLSNLRRSIHFWCNTPRHLERLCFSSYVSGLFFFFKPIKWQLAASNLYL